MGSPEADVYEASITAALMQEHAERRHVPMAIFPRRKFTHQLLLTRKDSKIRGLADFAGKRVGILRWYEHPLGVWLRGDLSDRYGISPREIHWFTDGQNVFPLNQLAGVEVTLVPPGGDLVTMLISGEIDVLAQEDAYHILRQQPSLRRVFPDFKEIEAGYFHETGIFPAYHLFMIERKIAEGHGWVAASLVRAFEEAKQLALTALERDNSLVTSPWVAGMLGEQCSLVKRDIYPYGLEANRKELETLLRYLYEQGLIPRRRTVEELFAKE